MLLAISVYTPYLFAFNLYYTFLHSGFSTPFNLDEKTQSRCLALVFLHSAMYVLHCPTTWLFHRTSAGMSHSLTFTNHTHSFIHTQGHVHRLSQGVQSHGYFSPVMRSHTSENTCIAVLWDGHRKVTNACPSNHLYHTNTRVTVTANTKHISTWWWWWNRKPNSHTGALSLVTCLFLYAWFL